MNPTPNADECIRMIKKIEELNFIFSIKQEPITDETISLWGDKKDQYLKLDREHFDNLLYWGNYYSIIINYRLLPFAQIEHKGNSSFKQYKGEAIMQEFADFADKHIKYDKAILWQVFTEYDEVTSDDLKKEFWDIIPNMSSIQEYYTVIKKKYEDVFSEIPDKDYWNYFKLIEDKDFMAYYNSLVKYGVITKSEVEMLILQICNVVKGLDIACHSIFGIYKSFLPSLNDGKMTDESQPPHFNGDYTDEELITTFEKLKKGKYIHSDSDLDSWLYICKGSNVKTFTQPINWQKKGVLLGMFIQDLFLNTNKDRIWEITARCFTIQGREPNTNSIKTSLSKIKNSWKDRPKEYDEMKSKIICDLI